MKVRKVKDTVGEGDAQADAVAANGDDVTDDGGGDEQGRKTLFLTQLLLLEDQQNGHDDGWRHGADQEPEKTELTPDGTGSWERLKSNPRAALKSQGRPFM